MNIVDRATVDGVCYHEVAMPFPANLPLGFHSLSLKAIGPRGTQHATMTVIVVPNCGYLHPCVTGLRQGRGPFARRAFHQATLNQVQQIAGKLSTNLLV